MKSVPDKLCPIPSLDPLLLLQLHLLVLLEHTLQLYLQIPYSLLAYMGTASKKLVLNQELILESRPDITTYPVNESLNSHNTYIINIFDFTKPYCKPFTSSNSRF